MKSRVVAGSEQKGLDRCEGRDAGLRLEWWCLGGRVYVISMKTASQAQTIKDSTGEVT